METLDLGGPAVADPWEPMRPVARSTLGHRVLSIVGAAMTTLLTTGCPPAGTPPTPAPPIASFTEVLTDIGRGGRSVAVSINAANNQIAIVGTESGGLFRTTNGGGTWQHIDAFAPFRIVDVAFAEPGAADLQVVIVTTTKDAQTNAAANNGGIWRSTDAGLTWTHVAPTGCAPPHGAFDVVFLGNNVFVAADCGVVTSTDLGATWTTTASTAASSVIARNFGAAIVLDVCTQSSRVRRSLDAGSTWSSAGFVPGCNTPHGLAGSPLERDVLFAIATGFPLAESDDGGVTFTTNLGATSFNNRPPWVRTRRSMNGSTTAFDLYFSGRVVTCTGSGTGQRCPANVAESWPRLPANALNHDINGIAFAPGGVCPRLMVADYGVYAAAAAAPGFPCGLASAWTGVGRPSNGLHSLQIYQVAGQLQFPLSGPGISVSGSTHLFIGTQDNGLWANFDAGAAGWQPFGIEGSFLQVVFENTLLTAAELQLTYLELGSLPPAATAAKLIPRPGGASWNPPVNWTTFPVPGNAMPPVLIAPGTYLEWGGTPLSLLLLTTDGGATFTGNATLPPNPITPGTPLALARFGSTQLTKTTAGPAVYEFITDGTNTGLALLSRVSPVAPPRVFEVRTFGGLNGQGLASGLTGVLKHCFGQAIYCQPVFAVDPNDYNNLIAADPSGTMAQSSDAGRTWQPKIGLTSLVTAGGTLLFNDAILGSQVRAIAYDPRNSQHILVGTDQAGIIASANGGVTWSAVPGTTRATAITSFFFDDRTGSVYVATYGRGLWKLVVDWSTV